MPNKILKKANSWSANQLKFQTWLATPSNVREYRTQADFAEAINVNSVTLSKWKKLTLFDENGNRVETWQEAVNSIARVSLGEDLPNIYAALRKAAKSGSYQHIKLCLELLGDYVERKELTGKDGEPIGPLVLVKRDDD